MVDVIPAAVVARPKVTGMIRRALARTRTVALTGPPGSGKTSLLGMLGDAGERVLRLAPTGRDRDVSYATVTELLSALPAGDIARLPEPRRLAVRVLLRQETGGDVDHLAVRLAVTELLSGGRTLVLLDNADDVDEESADILAFAGQHTPDGGLALVAARRTDGPPGAVEIAVPPWDLDEIAELLAGHGLPQRLAGRVFRACGGNPRLAVRIGAAMGGWPRADTALPLPEVARRPVRAQLASLSASVRTTLLYAALSDRPSTSLLARAGRASAREDLAATAAAGLTVSHRDGRVAFTSGLVADTVRDEASSADLVDAHAALAGVTDDPVAAVWHRAHLSTAADEALAAELDAAALTARERGARARSAELSFLAAERTPAADQAAMLRRFVAAAGDAGLAGDVGLTRRAAAVILGRVTEASMRVVALTAVIECAGQALGSVDDVFADMAEAARDEPGLRAILHLWISWRYYICEGDTRRAHDEAREAHRLAVEGGNLEAEIEALTTAARLARALDLSDVDELLDRAGELDPDVTVTAVRGSAKFIRARNDLFDDRLDSARDTLLALVPIAQRHGDIKDHSDVLRSLAEVEIRAGRCALALDHIRQATDRLADSDTSTATVWYVVALAETAGGELARAASFARQGLRSAHEDHDVLFTSRCLFALGRVQMLTGDVATAAQTFREVRAFETAFDIADPAILQWHRELAEALAMTGDLEEAARIIDKTRVEAAGKPNVLAGLDHADGVRLLEGGDAGAAARRFTAAREGFARLGLPLEEGRTLLAMARLERRRRRKAAARALLAEAAALFARCAARPWSSLVDAELERLDGAKSDASAELTEAEARLAALVASGVSNTEAAAKLYISVKTVEATLTRVYRKLGLRSRAQLAARLAEPTLAERVKGFPQ
ncbi:transcriptional regulator [Actinorhabdospora filicis]|uniref:Transcriptional regulator n=1 Tax=Actinorhabdospora filicis TaxID=1785913 RepID=A0A9W6SRS2_9ACTN|nr:LuxR family transcriptional regulator [Actinorhabdospora filicis]GLZ81730.1 transcriptional regulator [Actinorhabdospora filicis]